MYYKYVISSTIGLFFGIVASLTLNFSTEIFIVSLFLSLGNFFIFKFLKNYRTVYKSFLSKIFFVIFLFTSIGILIGQYSISQSIEREDSFKIHIDDKNSFTGTLTNIERTQNTQKFILNIKDEKDISYKVQIVTGLYPKYKSGNKVQIDGKFEEESIILPDIENYRKSYSILNRNKNLNIDAQMYFPKIILIDENHNKSIFQILENSKNTFVETLEKNSSIKVAALSGGILLGDSSLFSKEDLANFRNSGLSHIIVLSGFNITILILFLIYIFFIFNIRLKYRILLSIFSIFIFIIFVGASPSIIRAGIMGAFALISNLYGRQYVAKQTLFISAFIMMCINPYIALYDISFHLSFLATFAIIFYLPIFEEYDFIQKINDNILGNKNKFLRKFLKDIFDILKVTFVIQIFVSPYIMFAFGNISLFGIFANILVLPLVPIIMILGIFIIIFSFFSNSLSFIFAAISDLFCKYIFYISEYISSISINKYQNNISIFNMFVIYMILLLFLFFEQKRKVIKEYLLED